ncbi:MAG TPA: hypothetical protein VIQ62_00285 [Burkholderiales bacterium]
MPTIVLISTSIRATVFARSRLMVGEHIIAFVALLPIMLLGLRLGARIQKAASRARRSCA